MAKGPLRAVSDGETAPKTPKTIHEAASSGDLRATLAKLRDRLSKTLDDVNTPPRDLAALSRRFLEVVREIDEIDSRRKQEASEDGEAAGDEKWTAV